MPNYRPIGETGLGVSNPAVAEALVGVMQADIALNDLERENLASALESGNHGHLPGERGLLERRLGSLNRRAEVVHLAGAVIRGEVDASGLSRHDTRAINRAMRRKTDRLNKVSVPITGIESAAPRVKKLKTR